MSQKQRKIYTLIFFPILFILIRINLCKSIKVTNSINQDLNNSNNNNNNNNNNNKNIGGQIFAMEPQDQTAIVGSRVTLPCRVIDKVGSLQWTKDDFGLGEHRNLSGFERYSMIGSDEEGDFSLDIYPVMLDDDAKYQCQVGPGPNGQPGIRSRFATLTVLVPPEAPKIVQGDFLLTTEDREIELECISVGGKPAAEITWIDGLGNVLTKGIDYVKEPFADSRRFTAKSILKLTPKKEHHNTTFTCQAQNTADRTYRSAKILLEVKYAPKVSVSVIGGALAGGRIPEGAEVRLSCHADANPNDLNYRWYINDEFVVGDYTTEMIIHNVTRKYHDAIVKCEVYNTVGKSEESETLDISYGPIFRHQPKSVEADIGSVVTLSCDVDGNPSPDIVWINEASDKVVGTSPNLTITVTHETAGRYSCKASVIGFPDIASDAMVYLKRSPTITSQRTQFGIVGDNAHIECVAFSVPKARHVSWTFGGHEINTSNNLDYSILEDPLPEGIKSTLIIRESQPKHFGRYNCTVVNEYGSDILEINFIPHKSVPMLMIVVGAMSCVAIIMMLIMLFVLYFKRGKKKLPPADVIPELHISEKGCKESDRSSNISDLKVDIRSGSCEPADYSETCSGTDSIATRLAANILGVNNITSTGGNNLGVPLTGPVKIPNDYRYSGDYSDSLTHLQQVSTATSKSSGIGIGNNNGINNNNINNSISMTASSVTSAAAAAAGATTTTTITNLNHSNQHHNNNGYVPYVDYIRAGEYSPPTSSQNLNTLRNSHNSNNSNNIILGTTTATNCNNGLISSNSSTTSNGSNGTITMSTSYMNGQIPSGNLSLNRNRNDLRQDNGLPNVQSSLNSLQNGLLGSSLLQNGIDPRYSATYSNPYLRTSNSSLPPLPPPSTANPAATPAPPPYHHATRNHHNHQQSLLHNSNKTTSSLIGLGSNNSSSSLLIGSSSTLPSQSSLQQQQQQQQHHHQQQQQLNNHHQHHHRDLLQQQSSTQSLLQQQQHHQQQQQQQQQSQQQQTLTSPSGQFILPANGNLKKGALATHV